MVPFYCCRNYTTVSHIGMQIFNFFVLSVIIAPHNVHTLHIRKTICLLFHLTFANLNRTDVQKTSQWKRETFLRGLRRVVEAQIPLQSLKIYQTELPLFIHVCIFRMRFSLNNLVFASDTWAKTSSNELEWA